MNVQWVGGPHDGQWFAVPDGRHFVDIVELADPSIRYDHEETACTAAAASYRERRIPIRLTRDGWRANWNERA